MTPATLEDYMSQANVVLSHYMNLPFEEQTATTVHFNFMARGEPLLNPTVVDNSQELFDALSDTAKSLGLSSKFKISTIYPSEFKGELSKVFADPRSMMYYSIYSTDPKFRKKWLPRAEKLDVALLNINIMQTITGRDNNLALHWAYIEGENDSTSDAHELVSVINEYRLKCKINIVRYNPYDKRYGNEPSEDVINKSFEIITQNISTTKLVHKIVPRVGSDVKASCGMFIE
jgi:adenine C2-methylase RlmN of 23S rRNA A2503 and tRNA A37